MELAGVAVGVGGRDRRPPRSLWYGARLVTMLRTRLVSAVAFFALAAEPAESFELRPGVVVDAARTVVYLMNPNGGIDAVDAASGRVVWTSMLAAKPLFVDGPLLLAQAEQGAAATRTLGALD